MSTIQFDSEFNPGGTLCKYINVGILVRFQYYFILSDENRSGKRIIRYEEGKLSEVFTLIFPDTMENNWFLNSNKDKSYIEIEESELDLILYGTLDRESKQGEQKDQLFRL